MPERRTKELILFRHAKSSWDDPLLHDFDRPLNRRGRRAAVRMAGWMADAKYRPTLVLCSPAARTRETHDIVRAALGKPEVKFERALYLASAARLLQRLRKLPAKTRSVMLIGHNPGLQRLALKLSAGQRTGVRVRINKKFPTAALVRFAITAEHWRDLGPETTRLLDFVRPRDVKP
ncbi:MAG: histidine phosphatase family protein [Alphaproteobacteria bacterium]|nr:histidine phosphatase family protein [Alphaproteobacteria bacterium]